MDATKDRTDPSTYLICTAPRSGSTLLAEALFKTGLAGNPHEYFNTSPESAMNWQHLIGVAVGSERYFCQVMAKAASPNGVRGIKLHWDQRRAFNQALTISKAQCTCAQDQPGACGGHADKNMSFRYIFLIRRNKIAQAISFYLALSTNIWRTYQNSANSPADAAMNVAFDAAQIRWFTDVFEYYDECWRRYFAASRIHPLVIHYEDLIEDYEATIRSALRFIGVADNTVAIVPPSLQRQAGAESMEWEQRYRTMASRRSVLQKTWHAALRRLTPVRLHLSRWHLSRWHLLRSGAAG